MRQAPPHTRPVGLRPSRALPPLPAVGTRAAFNPPSRRWRRAVSYARNGKRRSEAFVVARGRRARTPQEEQLCCGRGRVS